MNIDKIRKDFPILQRKINKYPLVYFDNSATTQKPKQVINSISNFYKKYNANIHRGVHTLSQESSELFEKAHEHVARFINAKWEEIVFTSGTTESLNLLANSIDFQMGDEILLTVMEHHSNIVPWQEISLKYGLKLKYVDVNEDGTLNMDDFLKKISKKTKVVSVTHISNVTGVENDVKRIGKVAKENGTLFIVDGAQSVPHKRIDVKNMNCDFLAFSAHKMLGPTGIGALYGKKELLEKLKPFILGGGMIQKVELDKSTFNKVPWKFEAGTPNVAGAVGFSEAIKYLEKIGMSSIDSYEKKLTKKFLKEADQRNLVVYGPNKRAGIVSFNIPGIHPHDIADLLDKKGIAVRSGQHCAQPLMRKMGIQNCVRASFYLYNTEEEISNFFSEIDEITMVMK